MSCLGFVFQSRRLCNRSFNKQINPFRCLLESVLYFYWVNLQDTNLNQILWVSPVLVSAPIYIIQMIHSLSILKCGVLTRSLQRGGLLRRPAGPRLSLLALPRRHHRRRQLHRGRGRARRRNRRHRESGNLVAADPQQRGPLLDAKYEPQI